MEKVTEKVLQTRQAGGDGYFLPANTAFTAEMGGRAMNIDWTSTDAVIFSVLEAIDPNTGQSVNVLSEMNIDGVEVSTMIRNFTKWGGFTKVTANKDLWLNLENSL